MTPEGRVKRAIRRALGRHGVWHFMPVPHSAYGGLSVDFLGCYRGRFIAIEAKAPGRRPTLRQRRFLEAVERAGGVAVVIDSEEEAESKVAELVRRIDDGAR